MVNIESEFEGLWLGTNYEECLVVRDSIFDEPYMTICYSTDEVGGALATLVRMTPKHPMYDKLVIFKRYS